MEHGSAFPVLYLQRGHRYGLTVPSAAVRHDLRWHPAMLSGDQLPVGGQTEQADTRGGVEEQRIKDIECEKNMV